MAPQGIQDDLVVRPLTTCAKTLFPRKAASADSGTCTDVFRAVTQSATLASLTDEGADLGSSQGVRLGPADTGPG